MSKQAPVYRDPGVRVEERVADLPGRMTLEEKVGQSEAAKHPPRG